MINPFDSMILYVHCTYTKCYATMYMWIFFLLSLPNSFYTENQIDFNFSYYIEDGWHNAAALKNFDILIICLSVLSQCRHFLKRHKRFCVKWFCIPICLDGIRKLFVCNTLSDRLFFIFLNIDMQYRYWYHCDVVRASISCLDFDSQ